MPIQSAVDSATGIYVHTVTGALTREHDFQRDGTYGERRRMYETLATSLPRQISVFREYQEAVDWLLA